MTLAPFPDSPEMDVGRPQLRRILHVITDLGVGGGAEQQLVANLRMFRDPRLEHHVLLLTDRHYRDPASSRPPLSDHIPVHVLFPADATRRNRFRTVARMMGALRTLQPDLIHCSLAEGSLAARIAGGLGGVPVVESLVNISHEPVRRTDNPDVTGWKLAAHRVLDRMTMRRVARFHALTTTVADSWERTVGIPAEKIAVIPRGVDIEQLDRAASEIRLLKLLREELALTSNDFVILSVGRQEPQKGQRYLIEAMPFISRSVLNPRLLIAGRVGNASSMLAETVVRLGLDDRVRFLGDRVDVPRLLQLADVFVFPSLYEGMGNSLLEAMACRLATVTVDRAPMSEIVRDGVNGLLVPPRDPEALARAVIRVAKDPALRTELGRKARRLMEDDYRLEAVAPRLERLYLEVLRVEGPSAGEESALTATRTARWRPRRPR